MAKRNKVFQMIKGFIKRNAYALIVSFSVLAVFGVVSAISVADLYKVDDQTQPTSEQTEIQPTSSTDVIVFEDPVKNVTISKEYAEDYLIKDKTTGVWKTHQALDYAGPEGTQVFAVFDGEVESVDKNLMDGTIVTLKITDNLKVVYKSLANAVVNVGDKVKTGDEIGVMGTSTNEKAEGTHLHLEVLKENKLTNPNEFLSSAGK